MNIKISKAYRTVSYEASCILSGQMPIIIKLREITSLHATKRRSATTGIYDAPIQVKNWTHPAGELQLSKHINGYNYHVCICTNGVKSDDGVGAGIVIEHDKQLTLRKLRLHNECSLYQAEQLAVWEGLKIIENLPGSKELLIMVSRASTLLSIRNILDRGYIPTNARNKIRTMIESGWKISLDCKESSTAKQLSIEASEDKQLPIIYSRLPRGSIINNIEKESMEKWQQQWNNTDKGAITKSFFPDITKRIGKKLPNCSNVTAILSGHGKLRSYLHRFKIIEDSLCSCGRAEQTVNHVINECHLLDDQRLHLKNEVIRHTGNWPANNNELMDKYFEHFVNFVLSIDFEDLTSP